jgi:hypothetical protein
VELITPRRFCILKPVGNQMDTLINLSAAFIGIAILVLFIGSALGGSDDNVWIVAGVILAVILLIGA